MGLDPAMPVRLGVEATKFGIRVWWRAARLPFRLVNDLIGHEQHPRAAADTVEVPVTWEPPEHPEAEPEAAEAEPEHPEPVDVDTPAAALRANGSAPSAAPEPPRRAPAPEVPAPAEPEPEEAPAAAAPEPELEPPAAAAPAPPEPEEPAHVDEEAVFVAEFAESGAESGAGAQITVEEPWEGYRRMRAADVKDRVAIASAAECGVIQLYESTHRNRRSILDAVERRMKQLANQPS